MTASTAESIFEVRSSPEYVRLHAPEVVPHEHSPYPMIQRLTPIAEQSARSIAFLADRIPSWYQDEQNPSTIRIALTRYLRSYLPRPWFDIVVDLGIGLEAALLGDADHEEIGLRLRSRAAALLSTPTDSPSRIYNDVKRLYNLRSDIVHGSRPTQKAIDSELYRISTTERSSRPGEKGALALDRGRDLLRRAILARAFLDLAGKWPATRKGESPDIDGQMVELSTQEEWRKAWRGGLASLGLESAADPASDASLDVALPDS